MMVPTAGYTLLPTCPLLACCCRYSCACTPLGRKPSRTRSKSEYSSGRGPGSPAACAWGTSHHVIQCCLMHVLLTHHLTVSCLVTWTGVQLRVLSCCKAQRIKNPPCCTHTIGRWVKIAEAGGVQGPVHAPAQPQCRWAWPHRRPARRCRCCCGCPRCRRHMTSRCSLPSPCSTHIHLPYMLVRNKAGRAVQVMRLRRTLPQQARDTMRLLLHV